MCSRNEKLGSVPSFRATLPLIALCLCIASSLDARAADVPWFDPAWSHRSRVEVVTPPLSSGLNVVRAFIDTAGQAAPDGADMRVTDAAGSPVGFEVVEAKSARTFLVEFEYTGGATYYCYYGNPKAAKENLPWKKVLGGLTATSYEGRSGWSSPRTPQEFRQMMSDRRQTGRGRRAVIDDDENPVGPNDSYFLIYNGFLYAPADGTYGFSSNSDDASFLEIDGQLVVSWGDGHNSDSPDQPLVNRWQRRGQRSLQRGVHQIAYYQQNWTGLGLARAGWSPPGQVYQDLLPALKAGVGSYEVTPGFRDGYSVIPPEAFIEKLAAEQLTREERDQPVQELFVAQSLGHVAFNNNLRTLYAYRFRPPASDRELKGSEPIEWVLGHNEVILKEPEPVGFFDQTGVQLVTLRNTKTRRELTQEIAIEPGPRREQYFRWAVSAERAVYFRGDDIRLDVWLENLSKTMPLTLTASGTADRATNPPKEIFHQEVAFAPNSQQTIQVPLVRGDAPQPEWSLCKVQLLLGGRLLDERRVLLLKPEDHLEHAAFADRALYGAAGSLVLLRSSGGKASAQSKGILKSARTLLVVGSSLHPIGSQQGFVGKLSEDLKGKGLALALWAPDTAESRTWRLRDLMLRCLAAELPDGIIVLVSLDSVDAAESVDREDWARMLAFTIDAIRAQGGEPVVLLPPPLPTMEVTSAEMSAVGERVSYQAGAETIDLVGLFRGRDRWQELFVEDGVMTAHPQPEGQALIADAVRAKLQQLR